MSSLQLRHTAPGPAGRGQVTYLVLAKAPVPGSVKTRLTPAYSDHEAAALAAAALLDTLDAVLLAGAADGSDEGLRPVVALSGEPADGAAPDAVQQALGAFTVVLQRGDDLGPRIAHAHRDAAGDFGPTVQIGMDTPQVDPRLLAAAAALVVAEDGPDAVLGLAEDGGWWLLALRRAGDARLVAPVPMSTPETGQLTRAALERGGLRVDTLPSLRDVDEPGDVALVAGTAPDTRFAALAKALGPRTTSR